VFGKRAGFIDYVNCHFLSFLIFGDGGRKPFEIIDFFQGRKSDWETPL
jgi:hypothetical protein